MISIDFLDKIPSPLPFNFFFLSTKFFCYSVCSNIYISIMEFVDHRRNMEIIGEDQIIKGSGFSDGCFKDLRLGFASSNDVEENNESVDSAGSLFSDSSEIVDDDDEDVNASSSSCSSSSSLSSVSPSNPKGGPLYELSDLMAQLPIKRGLSKWYDGRSQSYTSLTSVRSLEDLMKKERPYNKRLKLCRSYEGDLDSKPSNKVSYSPKPTISKKKTKGSNRGFSFLSSLGKEEESPKASNFSKLHTNSSSSLR